MKNIILNDELEISFPESFREMSEEELAGLNYYKEAPKWCVKDEENHIIMNINWKKAGLFSSAVLDSKDMVKSMDKKLDNLMSSFGYTSSGYTEKEIGGEKALTFSYTYTVADTDMTGECMSLKKGRTFYYIYLYYRTENAEKSRELTEGVLSSAKFI